MEQQITMLPNEFWYGLATAQGTSFPLSSTSTYSYSPTQDCTPNQESPILLSSKGRYLWSKQPYDVDVKDGIISVTNAADDFKLYDGFSTLRGGLSCGCQDPLLAQRSDSAGKLFYQTSV